MLALAQNWAGKGFLFVVIALFAWHAAHRIFHSLHDLGVHGRRARQTAVLRRLRWRSRWWLRSRCSRSGS
jgi:fumarate reductase subunit D